MVVDYDKCLYHDFLSITAYVYFKLCKAHCSRTKKLHQNYTPKCSLVIQDGKVFSSWTPQFNMYKTYLTCANIK